MTTPQRAASVARGRAEVLARLDMTLSQLSPVQRPLPQVASRREQE